MFKPSFLAYSLLATLIAAPISAADLTGHWQDSHPGPDGQMRETSLYLTDKAGVINGYVQMFNQDPSAISNAKLNGNDLTFSVTRDFYGEQRTMNFNATLNGDELILHLSMPGGPTHDIALKHVSTTEPGPMPPPSKKITLPPAADVPYNGLAKTPPMGWNSWNKFARNVTDKLVRETADAMVSNGMKDAGYEYINIDDTWEAGRDAQGNIQTNEKFPDMKALADYVHSKGLKIGLYSSPGPKTCAGYEGSLGHEEQDAKTYANWGFDYLKYDWCSAGEAYDYHSMQAAYAKMGEALLKSGHPIVYSLCQYGLLNSPSWAAKVGGNLWRTTGDISDSWKSMSHIGFDLQASLAQYAGPGHWNDPDMLEVGNGGMSETEYRTHMSLWSLLAAPLLAGNDLRDVPKPVLEILTNREVIAVDQDKLGKQASRVSKNGDAEVWSRPLADGGYAVGLFNRGTEPVKITALWSDVGLKAKSQVRDLWKHSDEGNFADSYSAEVPSHGVVLLKITAAP